jgi:hypothetical protein
MSHITHTGVTLANYKGIDSAITQRPTSTALLAIDSEDRYKDWNEYFTSNGSTYKSPYDFTIEKKESLMNGFFTRLGLTEINFPWIVPNINKRTQSIIFSYTVGGGPQNRHTITLRSGFRTPAQLATDLQVAIRAIDPVNLGAFTVTYGIFTNDTASTLSLIPIFEFKSNNILVLFYFYRMPYNSVAYPYDSQNKQLIDLLALDYDPTGVGGQYAYGGATFCQAIRYIDIVCSQLVNNQALKDTMSQTIARDSLCRLYIADPSTPSNVPCNSATFCPIGCAPFQLYRDFNTPKQINWLPNQPIGGSLRFQVFDDGGILLTEALGDTNEKNNKIDWSMTLLVTEN